jgi:hypothetical protein
VTQPGDLWTLGVHRVLCGDARDPGADARLMAGKHRSKHELILVFKNGRGRHINNIELGRNRIREFIRRSSEF